MQIRKASGILGAAFISISLVACGGPDIDKAKEDFANPSGKTADKNGVIAAQGKQGSSQGAMQLGAGGVPGIGLTATGKGGFAKASLARLLIPQAERMRARVQHTPSRPFALNLAQSEGCGSAEASAAFGEDITANADGEVSGSASFSIDFSSCAGSGMTGKADYSIDYEITQELVDMTVTVEADNLCEEGGDCLTGSMLMNLHAEGGLTGGSFETIMVWDLEATHEGEVIKTKGGIKLGFSELGANIGILVYVTTADGEEWSYVLEASQSFSGEGTLTVRGSDGEAMCTWHEDGTGQCTGDAGALEWTAADSEEVESSEWYSEG